MVDDIDFDVTLRFEGQLLKGYSAVFEVEDAFCPDEVFLNRYPCEEVSLLGRPGPVIKITAPVPGDVLDGLVTVTATFTDPAGYPPTSGGAALMELIVNDREPTWLYNVFGGTTNVWSGYMEYDPFRDHWFRSIAMSDYPKGLTELKVRGVDLDGNVGCDTVVVEYAPPDASLRPVVAKDDGYARNGGTDWSIGTEPTIRVGRWHPATPEVHRGYIRFPGAVIPQNVIVTKATLYWVLAEVRASTGPIWPTPKIQPNVSGDPTLGLQYPYTDTSGSLRVAFHAADSPGIPTTHNEVLGYPTTAAGLTFTPTWTAGYVYSMDVRSSVQAIVNRGGWGPGNSLMALVDAVGATWDTQIWARDWGLVREEPLLAIDWVPAGTSPWLTILQPTDLSVVSGVVEVRVRFQDDVTPPGDAVNMRIWIDGVERVLTWDSAGYWKYSWNTASGYNEDAHSVLFAVGYDTAGNSGVSKQVTVFRRNGVLVRDEVGYSAGYSAKWSYDNLATSPTPALQAPIRFTDVRIPQGASIISASLRVYPGPFSGTVPDGYVYGEDVDNAEQFSWWFAPRTSARTLIPLAAWNAAFGSTYTFDVTDIVQEIVDREYWASQRAMKFLLVGSWVSGTPYASVYNAPGKLPRLTVNFEV